MPFFVMLYVYSQIIPDFQVNSEDYVSKERQWMPAIGNYASGGIVIWYDSRLPSNGLRVFGARLDTAGDTIGTNFRINDDTTSGCTSLPDVDCDFLGNFTAVWIQNSNVKCRRFENDGTPLGSSFTVNDVQSSCSNARIDVDSSRQTVIVWSDKREGLSRIYCQIYDEGGIPVGANFPVSDSLQYMSMTYDVSIYSNNGFIVIWAYNYDIWCQRFNALGNRIGENFKVWHDTIGIDENYPVVRGLKDGNFLVTWSTNMQGDVYCRIFDSMASPITEIIKLNEPSLVHSWRPEATIFGDSLWCVVWCDNLTTTYVQRISSTGTLIGNNIQINEPLGLWNTQPDVDATDENIFVTWTRKITPFVWDIIIQEISPGGNLIGQNRVISDDKGGSPQYRPQVIADTTGDFFIVWDDFRNPEFGYSDQYGRRFDAQGNPLCEDTRINECIDAQNSSIGLNNLGLYTTVWARTYPDSSFQIYGQRFDRDGVLLGPNFQISQAPGNTGIDFPRIVMLGDNRFITTWSDYRAFPTKVYGRILDPSGIPQGDEFSACIDSAANNFGWSIVDENNGKFLLGMSCDQESIGVAIQQFDYDASPLSQPIILNERPTSSVIVAGAKGLDKYLFVWAGFDDINIYGQILSDSLQKIGTNLLVNDDTVSYKGCPSVVSSYNGKFFVVWHDGRNGDLDIYGQFFDSLGNGIGTNFKVDNDTANCDQLMPSCYSKNNLIYTVWSDARNPSHWFDIYCKVIEWQQTSTWEHRTANTQSLISLSPNPFRDVLEISVRKEHHAGAIELKIFDVTGRVVQEFLFHNFYFSPSASMKWDGKSKNGDFLPAGVYFVELNYDSVDIIKKVVKIR